MDVSMELLILFHACKKYETGTCNWKAISCQPGVSTELMSDMGRYICMLYLYWYQSLNVLYQESKALNDS